MTSPAEPTAAGLEHTAELQEWLLDLQLAIQRATMAALHEQAGEALARIARESRGDTIYEIDRGLDDLVMERCERLGERHTFVLIAEGDTRVFPAGAREEKAGFRVELNEDACNRHLAARSK